MLSHETEDFFKTASSYVSKNNSFKPQGEANYRVLQMNFASAGDCAPVNPLIILALNDEIIDNDASMWISTGISDGAEVTTNADGFTTIS